MDLSKIDNMTFDFDSDDFPDFSDCSVVSADYDGNPMSEDQLNELNENTDFVYESLIKYLY